MTARMYVGRKPMGRRTFRALRTLSKAKALEIFAKTRWYEIGGVERLEAAPMGEVKLLAKHDATDVGQTQMRHASLGSDNYAFKITIDGEANYFAGQCFGDSIPKRRKAMRVHRLIVNTLIYGRKLTKRERIEEASPPSP